MLLIIKVLFGFLFIREIVIGIFFGFIMLIVIFRVFWNIVKYLMIGENLGGRLVIGKK